MKNNLMIEVIIKFDLDWNKRGKDREKTQECKTKKFYYL